MEGRGTRKVKEFGNQPQLWPRSLHPGVKSAGSLPPRPPQRHSSVRVRPTYQPSTSLRKQSPVSTTESQGGPRALHQSRQQDNAKQHPCLVKPQEDRNSVTRQHKMPSWAQRADRHLGLIGRGKETLKIDMLSQRFARKNFSQLYPRVDTREPPETPRSLAQ